MVGYDVAQICERGHVVNSMSLQFSESNEEYCSKCGARTITACPSCDKPIRGSHVVNTEDEFGYEPMRLTPSYCRGCGEPYPWTRAGLDAAKEMVAELAGLDADEKKLLQTSIDDIASDTPRTDLAASRIKRLLAKVGKEAAETLREIVIRLAVDTAKGKLQS